MILAIFFDILVVLGSRCAPTSRTSICTIQCITHKHQANQRDNLYSQSHNPFPSPSVPLHNPLKGRFSSLKSYQSKLKKSKNRRSHRLDLFQTLMALNLIIIHKKTSISKNSPTTQLPFIWAELQLHNNNMWMRKKKINKTNLSSANLISSGKSLLKRLVPILSSLMAKTPRTSNVLATSLASHRITVKMPSRPSMCQSSMQ